MNDLLGAVVVVLEDHLIGWLLFPVEGHQAQAIQAHNLHLLLLLLLGSPPVSIGRCLEGSQQRRLEPTIPKVVEPTCKYPS